MMSAPPGVSGSLAHIIQNTALPPWVRTQAKWPEDRARHSRNASDFYSRRMELLRRERAVWERKQNSSVEVPAATSRYLSGYQRAGVQWMYDRYKRGVGGVLGRGPEYHLAREDCTRLPGSRVGRGAPIKRRAMPLFWASVFIKEDLYD